MFRRTNLENEIAPGNDKEAGDLSKLNNTKNAYSCYFEFQLDESEFGRSRKDHNIICNEQLLVKFNKLEIECVQLYEEVSNSLLIEQINKRKTESPGKFLTWEHCSSSTANGRLGVMCSSSDLI